jgi:hypothetical protein
VKITLPPFLQSKLQALRRGDWLLEFAERGADRALWSVVQAFVVLGTGMLIIKLLSKLFP